MNLGNICKHQVVTIDRHASLQQAAQTRQPGPPRPQAQDHDLLAEVP